MLEPGEGEEAMAARQPISGYKEIDKARSRDGRSPWVLLCERIDPLEDDDARYIVCLVNPDGSTESSNDFRTLGEARARFEAWQL